MAFFALTSLACSKDNPSEQAEQKTQMATLEVNVSEGITTRATSVNDANIGTAAGDIQVLVFNGEGDLLAYGVNSASSSTISMSIPTGTVECYAVVNCAGDLSFIATKSVLLKRLSSILSLLYSLYLLLLQSLIPSLKSSSGAQATSIPPSL